MKIASIGAGPAGLYFALLMKKARPDVEISVYERNKPDDTFGWGVVFSDETLSNFEAADPESYAEIRRNFAYWDAIDTFYADTRVRSVRPRLLRAVAQEAAARSSTQRCARARGRAGVPARDRRASRTSGRRT